MKIALLTTDAREHYKDYDVRIPYFGAAPEALLQGFAGLPGVEIHVVSCIQRPMMLPEKLALNIWYHGLLVPKSGWMRTGYQGCIRATRNKLREINPDIVHGQGTERDCALDAIFSGYPNVLTIHGNMAEIARLFRARPWSFSWLCARLEDFTLARSYGVFCNSAYTESLVKPRAKKTWRISNPLRDVFFRNVAARSSNRRPVILNVGNVCERKRQIPIVKAFRALHARGCDFELRFIGHCGGDDYGKAFCEEIAKSSGYATYAGTMKVDRLIECFDSADALLHFPSEEAFGLVVAESMARNLKFFGANLGGIADIAAGVEGAQLIDGEDWDGLAAAVKNWVEQGAPRPATASAEMERRYHPVVIAKKHVEIYREIAGVTG